MSGIVLSAGEKGEETVWNPCLSGGKEKKTKQAKTERMTCKFQEVPRQNHEGQEYRRQGSPTGWADGADLSEEAAKGRQEAGGKGRAKGLPGRGQQPGGHHEVGRPPAD